MGLAEYRKKRNFSKTREPRSIITKKKEKENIFVVQEHHASHLHWDFRLEMNHVLKSWAVPKGPPAEAGIKRLAVQVEDHPLSYARFHGRIAEGNYGAGTVKIWDSGKYQLIEKTMKKIVFELHGRKLKGRYTLLFFQPPKNWLWYRKE
jgi:DNA ligase D-like protein (predicted 3'-phosphoesterase)